MTGVTETAVITAGMKSAAPIVSAAISSTIQSLKSASSKITDKISRELKLGYADFLEASYNRCQQVKTIVSGDHPVALLDVYVNLQLTCGDIATDDIDLIGDLEQYGRIVIAGTGGAGKSMFMKYLTVCRFENTKGKIPLFVELRNLNNLSKKDLLQYCFSSCSTAHQKVTFSSFEKVFAAGGFLLILDGFDEVDNDHKDEIERQILEIGRKNPAAVIVVSSRSDPRFNAWQNYYNFEVNKLNKDQVRNLINKVKSDDGIKRRFLKDLNGLWETHETFLSIPLLAVIMLITFGKFSEISPKATLFYKLAFQTLYREHDANKEQFKRPIFSGLEMDDFERSFAAFCALSYLDSKISFEESEAKKIAGRAKQYTRLDFEEAKYIKDLVQNVCMLQQEGVELTYVHRSFQEYFTAIFICGYHEQNLFDVISRVAMRENDSTLSMFKELDENKFEISWLIPLLNDYIDSLSEALASGSSSKAINWIFSGGLYDNELNLSGLMISELGRSSIIGNIGRIYPLYREKLSIGSIFMALRNQDLRKLLTETGAIKRKKVAKLLQGAVKGEGDVQDRNLTYTSEEDDWLNLTNIKEVMSGILDALVSIRNDVDRKRSEQRNVIVV